MFRNVSNSLPAPAEVSEEPDMSGCNANVEQKQRDNHDRLPWVVENGDRWPARRHGGSQRQLGSKGFQRRSLFLGAGTTLVISDLVRVLHGVGDFVRAQSASGGFIADQDVFAELWRSICHGFRDKVRSLSCLLESPACRKQTRRKDQQRKRMPT